MSALYYEVLDDVQRPNGWFLGGPVAAGIFGTEFLQAERVDVAGPIRIPIYQAGEPADFSFGEFSVPVVRRDIVEQIRPFVSKDVQILPVTVDGQTADYVILNVTTVVDCLDEQRSQITYWPGTGGPRDVEGKYLYVLNPVIDERRAQGQEIFRIANWMVPLIVSARVAKRLEGVTGIVLKPLQTSVG